MNLINFETKLLPLFLQTYHNMRLLDCTSHYRDSPLPSNIILCSITSAFKSLWRKLYAMLKSQYFSIPWLEWGGQTITWKHSSDFAFRKYYLLRIDCLTFHVRLGRKERFVKSIIWWNTGEYNSRQTRRERQVNIIPI